MTTTISFNINDLTDNGRHLLAAVTSQSRHLATILAPRDGRIDADVADGGDSDDVICVRVTDRLTWAERARRYGVSGLDASQVARDADGRPILISAAEHAYLPTEEHIAGVERAWGEVLRNTRLWEVPHDIVRRVRRDELAGADAWNAIAAAFVAWCAAGDFEVVISDDWITQTEAAALFGVTNNAVRQAVIRGSLPAWEDWREPNRQRCTRVSRAAAARLWGHTSE